MFIQKKYDFVTLLQETVANMTNGRVYTLSTILEYIIRISNRASQIYACVIFCLFTNLSYLLRRFTFGAHLRLASKVRHCLKCPFLDTNITICSSLNMKFGWATSNKDLYYLLRFRVNFLIHVYLVIYWCIWMD